MRGSGIEVELMKYADISIWEPKIGDIIFKDGFFTRWFALINGIDGDFLNVKQSGNLRLLVQGDYEEYKINLRKIKNSMIGSYSVFAANGVCYL
ncbi:MAG: hypothetical protein M0P71_13835 [Melioribacteraceae bacterium]|nr:hypothetical protein [Melioribacteraceae bacterium]